MKKILALVLAVAMLCSVAFALDADYAPGAKIKLGKDSYMWEDSPDKKVNSDNYSISKIDWKDGKKYIDSVSFNDDDNQLVVKLKQDYTLDADADASFYGTVKIREKGAANYFTASFGEEDDPLTIAYDTDVIRLTDDKDALFNYDIDTIYTVVDDSDNGVAYGTLEYDFGNEEQYGVKVRVYEDEELFLGTDEAANKDILKANADADADYIDFVEWVAHPTFTSNVTVEFYGAEEEDYVYEIKDGKLVVPSKLKWDKDSEVWTLTTRTLGAYVVSDVKLATATAEDATTTNPDTGANDVVGIAGALAVVAMVSAAAVSLKK